MKKEVRKRIISCLYGIALGDSMGMPTEMWSQNKIDHYFPDGVQELMPSLGELDWFGRNFQKGQVTDDTENTVFIIRSIEKAGGKADAQEFMKMLLYWEEHEPYTIDVIGPSTRKAIDAVRKGKDLKETGYFGTTNGAAMKISPVGILSDYRKIDQLVENVYQICLPTHHTGIAIGGASAIAACVSYAMSGKKDLEEMIHAAKAAARCGVQRGIQHPGADLETRIDMALNAVRNMPLYEARRYIFEVIGTGMETIETVPAALALILLSEGNVEKAARNCASVGGDTDTLGAICGGICGALTEQWEKEEYQLLEEVNHICFEDLADILVPYCPFA